MAFQGLSYEDFARKTGQDLCVVIEGKVYNVTQFLAKHHHEGQPLPITTVEALDGAGHSPDAAHSLLEEFHVADVQPVAGVTTSSVSLKIPAETKSREGGRASIFRNDSGRGQLEGLSLFRQPWAFGLHPFTPASSDTILNVPEHATTASHARTEGWSLEDMRKAMSPLRTTTSGLLGPQISRWDRFANRVSVAVGTPASFYAAAGVVIVWIAIGQPLAWNNTWQLIMNTISSVITFLMVFVLQTSQNRDTRHIHLHLAELRYNISAVDQKIDRLRDQLTPARDDYKSN
ncbi:hypothetical protein BZG36_05557 [Bifiguratus adelaidae]|uniref:Cytochrome b5 heme-binding domain-containing protein n=1 Tax=Bifiguratus adelaidae TaxID=1938954 RepID=A0A261XSW0_9FUNG|nr:hypothetical protein BZG36_05557 [Bifiguratus adelaidae]